MGGPPSPLSTHTGPRLRGARWSPGTPALAAGPHDPPVNTPGFCTTGANVFIVSASSPSRGGGLLPIPSLIGSVPILAPSPSHLWVLAIRTHPGVWLPTGKSFSVRPNCARKPMSLREGRAGRDPPWVPPTARIHVAELSAGSPKPPSCPSITRILPSGFLSRVGEGLGMGWRRSKRENDNRGNERWRRNALEAGGETLGVNRGRLMEAVGRAAPLVASSHRRVPWLLAAGFCP